MNIFMCLLLTIVSFSHAAMAATSSGGEGKEMIPFNENAKGATPSYQAPERKHGDNNTEAFRVLLQQEDPIAQYRAAIYRRSNGAIMMVFQQREVTGAVGIMTIWNTLARQQIYLNDKVGHSLEEPYPCDKRQFMTADDWQRQTDKYCLGVAINHREICNWALRPGIDYKIQDIMHDYRKNIELGVSGQEDILRYTLASRIYAQRLFNHCEQKALNSSHGRNKTVVTINNEKK